MKIAVTFFTALTLAFVPVARADDFKNAFIVLDAFHHFCIDGSPTYAQLVARAAAENFEIVAKNPEIRKDGRVVNGISYRTPGKGGGISVVISEVQTAEKTARNCPPPI